MATGIKKMEDLWILRRKKGEPVSQDEVYRGRLLVQKMFNSMAAKSDRMALEVASQALKLPHRYCPETFANLATSSILSFVKSWHHTQADEPSDVQPVAQSASAYPNVELLKLAGIDYNALPVNINDPADDGQLKPMEMDELPPLDGWPASNAAADVEMKAAGADPAASVAESAFSLSAGLQLPANNLEMELEPAGVESKNDGAAEDLACSDADDDGALELDLEDGAHARDEADIALQDAEQQRDFDPEEAKLSLEEAEQARAEMIADDDDDAGNGSDDETVKADGEGDEVLLKTSANGVESRCDRIEYFYRPQELKDWSLYAFKSCWDLEWKKPDKPVNENLSEAQLAAYAARRRERCAYLPQFLKDREAVRRNKEVVPVLIGRKIPNPITDFEGYAMTMITLLKPWRIPLPEELKKGSGPDDLKSTPGPELKRPDQTWTEAFKEWRTELDRKDADDEPIDQVLMRKKARDFIKHWGSFYEGAEIAKAETAARKAEKKKAGPRGRRGFPIDGHDPAAWDDDDGPIDPDGEGESYSSNCF